MVGFVFSPRPMAIGLYSNFSSNFQVGLKVRKVNSLLLLLPLVYFWLYSVLVSFVFRPRPMAIGLYSNFSTFFTGSSESPRCAYASLPSLLLVLVFYTVSYILSMLVLFVFSPRPMAIGLYSNFSSFCSSDT